PVAHQDIPHTISDGVVISESDAIIDGYYNSTGTFIGAAIGGAAGATIGSGDGRILAATVGTIVGMSVGAAAQKDMTSKRAQEILIRLNEGEEIYIVLERTESPFFQGDKVKVVRDAYGNTRVIPFDQDPYLGGYSGEGYDIGDMEQSEEERKKAESDRSFLYE
ncbi:MAG: glycine zipper 2TM domain-containing protein, partial [Verrucomicrobiota bacterium]